MTTAGQDTFSSAMAQAVNYKRWLLAIFRDYIGTSLLEVGIGDGDYFRLLPPGIRYSGLEYDAELIALAKERNPDGDYVQGDVCDRAIVRQLDSRGIDTVMCFNVLEHLSDDRAAVDNLFEILRPGGHLLLMVPAFECLYSDLDRLAGHERRYRIAGLRGLLPKEASVWRLHYINPIGGLGWWLNRAVSHRSLESARVTRQMIFFDRFVLPLSRALTPATRRLFGQSAICVAQKP